MQPDTAFWILSSTAQASAALSGLSIVVMVFQLRMHPSLRSEVIDRHDISGPVIVTGWTRAIHIVAMSAILFLAAAIASLATLGLVTPGSLPIPTHVLIAIFSTLVLTATGGGLLAYYVLYLARSLAPIPRSPGEDYIMVNPTEADYEE